MSQLKFLYIKKHRSSIVRWRLNASEMRVIMSVCVLAVLWHFDCQTCRDNSAHALNKSKYYARVKRKTYNIPLISIWATGAKSILWIWLWLKKGEKNGPNWFDWNNNKFYFILNCKWNFSNWIFDFIQSVSWMKRSISSRQASGCSVGTMCPAFNMVAS